MIDENLPLRVLKFGGTSVGDADRIRDVVTIVERARAACPVVVVVSAMGGVTGELGRAAQLAARADPAYREVMEAVLLRHATAAAALVRAEDVDEVTGALDGWARDLGDLLHGVSLVRECTPRTLDSILAFGELASSTLVAAAFRNTGVEAVACDARKLLVTDARFGHARLDADQSRARVRDHFQATGPLQVVTGFIAATRSGETTTLGRGGSDYTASLLGAMLDAGCVEIWTDVDGVLSADPRLVPDAFPLPTLSYEEVMELSHFGAKVVYPPSIHPVRERGIPLSIRNTLRPNAPGTWIGDGAPTADVTPVRGISSIPQVALLRLEGDGMVGVAGTAERLFRALGRAGVNVILISQASSEHSICFAVDPSGVDAAREGIEEEFRLERSAGLIDALVVEADCTIIAAVGAGMRDTPGLAGRLFSILGRVGINVRAIAQGSSELNISMVVDAGDARAAVRALHAIVATPPDRLAHVFVAGVGGVGRALLGQIGGATDRARTDRGVALRVTGVSTSKRVLLSTTGLEPGTAFDALTTRGEDGGGAALVEAALADPAPVRVLVDCTASDAIPAEYPRLLAAGVHVVTANKEGFSGPYERYVAIRDTRPGRVFLEATVGAGLPILGTIEDLNDTGDRVRAIEGALSGTLAFLFDQLMAGHAFSEAVVDARARGYTEPDPRVDLSGLDVLRKVLILARQTGLALEADEVALEPLLPGEGWDALSLEAFLERLPEVDAHFSGLRDRARGNQARLCYLGTIEDGRARVGLREVGLDHPCHGLRGTDNLVAIATDRYPRLLTVRGAGAGHDVTAAGVLADILRAVTETRGKE